MKKIYSKLAEIQQKLSAPKSLFNKFGNYYYRNAEGILEAVKPLLDGYVLVISDEPCVIGERYYIKATATLTDGEESVSSVAYAREDETKKGMDGCQITGACSSYARKYALNALLMIDDSKDSDDDSLSPKNPANAVEPAGPSFTRPKVNAPGVVSSVDKVEEIAKPKSKAKPVNPATEYLLAQMGALRIARGISYAENNELFKKQHEALIKAGLAPDKKLDEYTMDEAESLVEAMNKCFHLTGTELITE